MKFITLQQLVTFRLSILAILLDEYAMRLQLGT